MPHITIGFGTTSHKVPRWIQITPKRWQENFRGNFVEFHCWWPFPKFPCTPCFLGKTGPLKPTLNIPEFKPRLVLPVEKPFGGFYFDGLLKGLVNFGTSIWVFSDQVCWKNLALFFVPEIPSCWGMEISVSTLGRFPDISGTCGRRFPLPVKRRGKLWRWWGCPQVRRVLLELPTASLFSKWPFDSPIGGDQQAPKWVQTRVTLKNLVDGWWMFLSCFDLERMDTFLWVSWIGLQHKTWMFSPIIQDFSGIFQRFISLDIQIPSEDRCLNPRSHLLRFGF